jgi:hypothetical protein
MKTDYALAFVLISISTLAHASYYDGGLGVIILAFSFPAVCIGVILTILLFYFKTFEKKSITISYSIFWSLASIVALIFTSQANDITSMVLVLLGWLIFLALILGPVYLQYSRSQQPIK